VQLLEREADLAVLDEAVAAAEQGSGSFVLISGEAGIGKTSLVRAFVGRLGGGIRVLSGACDDLVTPRPLGPFHDMARAGAPGLRDPLRSGERNELFPAILAELDDPLATVVVTIEDVHWADDGTLDVLRFLARRVESFGAVVVLTYRSDEIDEGHNLRGVLATLPGARTHRIGLHGLSREALTALSRDADVTPDALLAVTGGNPFYVTEVLASPQADVPPTVSDAVLARVGNLSAPGQAALQRLSVVPSHVESWLVDALVEDAPEIVAEAEARGLLEVRAEQMSFRHELARRALEASLPAAAAVQHHRMVLAALRRHGGADVSRILHHAVAAGDVDVILDQGPTAAREAAAAGAHYQQVLRHADGLDIQTRATVHEEAAWELANAHRFLDAAEQAQRAVRHREQLGDPVALSTARVSLSRVLYLANRPHESLASVERAVADAQLADDSGALAAAEVWHGGVLQLLDRPHDAIAVLERAHALAAAHGSPELVSLALNYLGGSRTDLDDPGGVSLLEQSIQIALGVDHQEHAVRGYANIAEALAYLADYDRLRRYVRDGLAYARERDFASHEYVLEAHRCLLLVIDGHWAAAEDQLRRLVATVAEPGNTGRFSLPLLAQLATRRDADDARGAVDEAWRNAVRGDSVQALAPAAVAALEWAWLNGDRDMAVDRAQLALDRLAHMGGRNRFRGQLLRWLRRLDVAVDAAADLPDGFTAAVRGDWRSAADAFQRAGDRYAWALELADSGEQEPMLETLAVLDQLGAVAVARLVRGRLRALGVPTIPRGPQIRTRDNPAGLTPREMDVLSLLSTGSTNSEIAQQLVVSVRTVDHHVSALLQKLEVSSRREAVAAARSLGLLGDDGG
jgi:DNA-binding CsgD family transcriptional regulator